MTKSEKKNHMKKPTAWPDLWQNNEKNRNDRQQLTITNELYAPNVGHAHTNMAYELCNDSLTN